MKPFTELTDVILSPLKSAAVHGAANLAANIGTTAQLCITLYIILFGWQIARGEIAEPWNDFAKRAVKLGLIVALLQSPALYKEYVIDFLAETLPDALSSAMSGNPVPDANKFDTLAAKFGILLTQVWQGTGWSSPAATARAAVVTLIVMPFVWGSLIVGFVVTMWAKAGMYFVATLGPLFMALAMFEQTRRYLHNWLDQIVTMIVLQVLVAMTCGLVIEGLERAVKDAPTPETVFALAGKVIVLTVFSLAIWSSLPRLASKLGGYGASVAGAGSRAAPFDTARAPMASFSETGAAPSGRPELAGITSRAVDAGHSAMMPAPVISGDRVNAANAAATSSETDSRPGATVNPSSEGSWSQAANTLRTSLASAAPTTTESGSGAQNTTAYTHSTTGGGYAPTHVGSGFADVAGAGTVGRSDISDPVPIGVGRPNALIDVPPISPIAAPASRTHTASATVAGSSFVDPIDGYRTGFEGLDFEAPRASDAAITVPPSALLNAEPINPTPTPELPPTPRTSS